MTPELAIASACILGAAGLLLSSFRARKRADDLDPCGGFIVYEDVGKAPLPNSASSDLDDDEAESELAIDQSDSSAEVDSGPSTRGRRDAGRESGVEAVQALYFVDNDFRSKSGVSVALILYGKADRIVRKRDGAIHIIDFKSAFGESKVDYYRFQLIAYLMMFEQTFHVRPKKAIILYLDPPLDGERDAQAGGSLVEIENTSSAQEDCKLLLREMCDIKLGIIPEWLLDKLNEPSSTD